LHRLPVQQVAVAQRAPPLATRGHSKNCLAMTVGLVFSTLLGIYMAFKYNRSRALVWSMMLIGTAIPAGLLAMIG
jgi:hypothetical protein